MTYLWGNPGLAFQRELLTFQCGLPSFWERCASSSAQVTCSSRWPSEDAKCLFLWAAMVTVREVGQPRTGTLASYLWQSSLSLYSAPVSRMSIYLRQVGFQFGSGGVGPISIAPVGGPSRDLTCWSLRLEKVPAVPEKVTEVELKMTGGPT